jgi:hypothetical protein
LYKPKSSRSGDIKTTFDYLLLFFYLVFALFSLINKSFVTTDVEP